MNALIMDTTVTSETSVNYYQIVRRNNLEKSDLQMLTKLSVTTENRLLWSIWRYYQGTSFPGTKENYEEPQSAQPVNVGDPTPTPTEHMSILTATPFWIISISAKSFCKAWFFATKQSPKHKECEYIT
jgi:hypothetical protein